METLHGLVEHIVYHNENNGYTVMALMCQGDEVSVPEPWRWSTKASTLKRKGTM